MSTVGSTNRRVVAVVVLILWWSDVDRTPLVVVFGGDDDDDDERPLLDRYLLTLRCVLSFREEEGVTVECCVLVKDELVLVVCKVVVSLTFVVVGTVVLVAIVEEGTEWCGALSCGDVGSVVVGSLVMIGNKLEFSPCWVGTISCRVGVMSFTTTVLWLLWLWLLLWLLLNDDVVVAYKESSLMTMDESFVVEEKDGATTVGTVRLGTFRSSSSSSSWRMMVVEDLLLLVVVVVVAFLPETPVLN